MSKADTGHVSCISFIPWGPGDSKRVLSPCNSMCYCTVITHTQNLRLYTYMYKGNATRFFALQPKSGSTWLLYAYYLSSRAHILRSCTRDPLSFDTPIYVYFAHFAFFITFTRALSVYYLVSLWLKCQYFLTRFIKQIMHSINIVR